MRGILALLALCACGLALASDSSAPSQAAANPQAKAAQHAKNPQLDTSKLEQAIRESVKQASERENPNEQRHLSNEGKIADETTKLAVETKFLASYTFWLSVATAALAAIAFGQLWMFKRQLDLMREGADDAKAVAVAAKDSAKTARTELLATHRPKLIVRQFTLHKVEEPDVLEIRFVVANLGGSRAQSIWFKAGVWPDKLDARSVNERDWPPAKLPFGLDTCVDSALNSGETQTLPYRVPSTGADQFITIQQGYAGQETPIREHLYFFGEITYKDMGGMQRKTGFLRAYNFNERRFGIVNDPDYEYQD